MKASSRTERQKPGHVVRTTVLLDPKLVARVKRLAHVSTTRDALRVALEYYARSHDYSEISALYGTGGVVEGYDPKAAALGGVLIRPSSSGG